MIFDGRRSLEIEINSLRAKQRLYLGTRLCSLCTQELGLIFNRGAQCPVCLNKICKECRIVCRNPPPPFMCKVCTKLYLMMPNSAYHEEGSLCASEVISGSCWRHWWEEISFFCVLKQCVLVNCFQPSLLPYRDFLLPVAFAVIRAATAKQEQERETIPSLEKFYLEFITKMVSC